MSSGIQSIRVGFFAASPVHYRAPLYRRIAADPRIDFTAIFASSSGVRAGELGYGQRIAWDVDALSGFRSVFLRRADRNETTESFVALRDLDVVGTVLRGNFDVLWLHGYYSLTHVLAAAAQRARRRPVLFREVQTLLHGRTPARALTKRIGLPVWFKGAYGLYVGEETRRWFARYGIDESRLFFVPNCVDNERLQQEAARLRREPHSLRRRFGIAPDAGPVILTVGRLIPKKQPDFLLEAFRRARARTRCTLLVVGSGELEASLRAAIQRDAIPDVVLAGFLNQSEISQAYACADVFALASRLHETWGLVVNEAMNFALPVVVSDKVGCAVDLIRKGENGFVVSSQDPEELADRLTTLVESPETRMRFGRASLDRISGWNYDVAAEGVCRAVAAAVGPERWPGTAETDGTHLEHLAPEAAR